MRSLAPEDFMLTATRFRADEPEKRASELPSGCRFPRAPPSP